MSEEKKMKLLFADGVLEDMQNMMTEIELQEFLTDLQAKMDNGTLFEDSSILDLEELERDDPQLYQQIVSQLDAVEGQGPPTLH